MYNYYRSTPGYLSIVANISLVIGVIFLFFKWQVSIGLFSLTVILWYLSRVLHGRSILDDLPQTDGEVSTPESHQDHGNSVTRKIQRELERVELGTFAGAFELHPMWEEVKVPEKALFDSGFSSDERLFTTSSGDREIMCGTIFDKVYKVGVMAPSFYGKVYLKEFTNKYGQPKRNEGALYEWEDADTCLQLVINPKVVPLNIHLFLTDKSLVKKAYGL